MKKGYMAFGFFEEGKITFDCAGMSMERLCYCAKFLENEIRNRLNSDDVKDATKENE